MTSMLDMLGGLMGGNEVKEISQKLGTDEATTKNAMGAGLATLLGALQRNAAKPGGAEAIQKALDRDHDGSELGNLKALLNDPKSGNGDGILKHVLGDRRGSIESGLSKSTGLSEKGTSNMMSMLAPLVMGALGKQQKEKGLDASSLAGFLGQEGKVVEQKGGFGFIGKMLDSDGDGDFDLADAAKGVTKLFGR